MTYGRILIGHLINFRSDPIAANTVLSDVYHLAGIPHPHYLTESAPKDLRVPVMMSPDDGVEDCTIQMTSCMFDGSQGNGKRIENGATVTLPRREAVAIVSAGGGVYA